MSDEQSSRTIGGRPQFELWEATASCVVKLREIGRLVFASHDERLVSRFREIIGPGTDVLSLTDVGLPEPGAISGRRSRDDILVRATTRATVVAAMTDIPAAGLARGPYIDAMLRWGGGGPQWYWPLPWPYASAELSAELKRASHDLDASGYCGPDDRGAYLRSALCLVVPDAASQVFEGRLEGQFGGWCLANKLEAIDDYFIPDGERASLASLTDEARRRCSDQERAFEAFRAGLSD